MSLDKTGLWIIVSHWLCEEELGSYLDLSLPAPGPLFPSQHCIYVYISPGVILVNKPSFDFYPA